MVRRSPATLDELLLDGQTALRQGDKVRAQALFRAILRNDPTNEEALLWLSGAVEPAEAVGYLNQILAINPDNQQAQEGLDWLRHTYGVVTTSPPEPQRSEALDQTSVEPTIEAQPVRQRASSRPEVILLPRSHPELATSRGELVELGSYVAGIGALLGLLRLVIALRPTALLIGRGEAGGLSWLSALGIAFVGAIANSSVLVLLWWKLASVLDHLREDWQGGRLTSLRDTCTALLPGYFVAPALGLALLTVGWSEQRWLPVVLVIALLLGIALLSVVRRILRLFAPLRIDGASPRLQLLALFGPPLLLAALGFWLANRLVVLLLQQA